MSEKKYDNLFDIKTTGMREWMDDVVHYNRYEATPYSALDKLFKVYKFKKTDKILDFGCGLGRVAFYINNRFNAEVTGIEANYITYEEALVNKKRYISKMKHIKAPINFKYIPAEHYPIDLTDNRFYFFNPFSTEIFMYVVNNILFSLEKQKRPVDIILYYPSSEYQELLKICTPFQLLYEIKVTNGKDNRNKFLIYRLE